MRQVTIHTVDGQTDRDLERALLALDPQAQVQRVSGRLGRTGVRVCAHLALLYLVAEESWDSFVWHDHTSTTAADVEVTVTGLPEAAATTGTPLVVEAVAETPTAAPAKPKKTATKKKTEEV